MKIDSSKNVILINKYKIKMNKFINIKKNKRNWSKK